MEVDHQTPLARGGIDIAPNLVPCCGPCNAQKGLKTAGEFRDYLIRVGIIPRFFGSIEAPRDWLFVTSKYDSPIAYAGLRAARRRFVRYASPSLP